ncbi:helix-turn-helix domain-containing protein [Mycobacterium spongiae]|uniref:XRE family transcriptional regulator n=1 Tax=Mycobacterium spongiae TaxID=886343 RepID=A0A975JZS0_9MYCO|nr:helix-turn-helix transcriptional regulator [Mycobacterium spongiae]QUR68724.1 XRE family transcriptional regulator [Mycobacterium spongiae]
MARKASEGAKNSELAEKLNKLFDLMRVGSKPPLSNAAAAEAITRETGISISPAYLWQLRSGIKTNPTVAHLRAIAQFFGVTPSYLVDPGIHPEIDAQLNLLQALRDSGVRDLALRASGLTPQAIQSLATMVDHVRELEQLPPVSPTAEEP